ncbi:unnamed protein product, partial [Adineta steineri]
FNRSLLIPYNQVYPSLYGDDDKSSHLMKTFCQSQDHYMKDEDNNNTHETSSSFGFCQDTDSDIDSSEIDDDDDEKKKSYDSGYGSVMPRRPSRLIPIDVDIHTKKNMDEHSTSHYDIPGLVLRRGQPFSFTVTFNRDFEADQYHIYVRLAIGARSMISKKTQIRLLVDGTPNANGWAARKIPTEGEDEKKKNNRISLQVDSPSDAIIGKYTLLLEVRSAKKEEEFPMDKQDLTLFLFEVDIYFLFNPWKKEDACALQSPEQIAEYVMNEHGQIFLGSSDKPRPIPWYFGQFEKSALHAALTLLDNAQLPPQNRVDPSIILRILSSKICSNPGANNGIFSSSYNVRPVTPEKNGLTSSTAILKHYLASNCRSVHGGSGTNWQHAAILCTLSRALGIPCRIVTVYNAACRADGTDNNDVHWDTKQRPLQKLNSDLICTSQVWNECWMRRVDLPNNEQDWQIIDSTPVPMCDGIRRTGPCPVSCLKKGDLGFRWDSPYIHSSINGNKSHWIVYPDGYMEMLDVERNKIGTKIITRSLTNETEPEDITERYKNAAESSNEAEKSDTQSKNDVNFELLVSEENRFGDTITLAVNVHNKSEEKRTIKTAFTICIASGTGPKSASYTDYPVQTLNLDGGKDETIQFKISPPQYMKYGPQENIVLKYFVNAQIPETNQTYTRDSSIIFIKDDVAKPFLNEDVIEIGKPVLMKIQIANTLSRPLNNGRVYIDGLGLNQIMRVNRSFAPKESTTLRVRLHPTRVGVSRLYITFIADCLYSSTQSIPLEITRDPVKTSDRPAKKSVDLPRKQSEPSGKPPVPSAKQDEPPKEQEEILQKQAEPAEKSDASPEATDQLSLATEMGTEKTDEPTEKTDEPSISTDEPSEKIDEPSEKTDEPSEKTDESSAKTDEPSAKTDEPSEKTDEPTEKTDESTEKPDEPAEKKDEQLLEKPNETSEKADEAPEKQDEVPKESDKPAEKQDEPAAKPEEPSEKHDKSSEDQDETLSKTGTDVPSSTEEKSETPETIPPSESATITENQDESLASEAQPATLTLPTTPTVEAENPEITLSPDTTETKSDAAPSENQTEDGDPADLQNIDNLTLPGGKSIDKDKISVDSLDMSNDRRTAE